MTMFQFLFLSRDWKKDQIRMQNTLDSILTTGRTKMAILIYPEGTNMSISTYPKSKKYAEKVGHPVLHNVLLPHTTGLFFCSKLLQAKLSNPYLLVRFLLTPGLHRRL